jgi:glycosyltransferase involved in cell wall biosynthesis
VVDDGSTDHTVEELNNLPIHLIKHNHPLGKNWILLIIPIYAKVSKNNKNTL